MTGKTVVPAVSDLIHKIDELEKKLAELKAGVEKDG